MPQVYISSFGGVGAQFFDNNGVILSGGKIYSYAAGTTTPAATYTDTTGTTPHSNPIVLNSAGRVPNGEIWLIAGNSYKFVVETSVGVTIATYDNVAAIASGSALLNNFTGNGSQISFTLSSSPVNENSTNIYINGVYQQKNTYSITGASITFSEAPPLTSKIEVMYF